MNPFQALPPSSWSNRFHIVLVEPGDSINIGSVARGMSNLGFSNLHLVAPPRFDPEKAATSACWATPLLEQAKIHDNLEDALQPMSQAVGFTARYGRDRPRHLLLPDWAEAHIPAEMDNIALLFGPEDHGLTKEHLAHCRWLVRIPSMVENPSFNLAQSVLLAMSELSRVDWGAIQRPVRSLPPLGEFQQLDRLVEEVLTRAGFYYSGTPAPVPAVIRHLLRRIDPDERDMGLLMGMFGKINRALQGQVPIHPFGKEEPAQASKATDGPSSANPPNFQG